MKFYIKSLYPEDEKKNGFEKENGIIEDPIELSWSVNIHKYSFEWSEKERPAKIFLSPEYILILFYKNSIIHPHPNNLVMYNLKKEIVRIVLPPKPINWNKISPIYSIGEIKEIDGENFLATYIDTDNDFSKEKGVMGFIEIRWLNLKTFEYHPTENTFIKDYGR
ncbi:hypothetical protein SD427_01080 [Chryseobacterium sp. JJR-5R]|uniref:hypothetical protein n=1 Tax=Chryseobacterium sp. JJR-5R TaxID=3093923 RepID=UPI002A758032|nr:hypothetical protein [Chryseobacterium sp. JJR-5R]WPO82963.1 hypothetical protein SD427_01080 [Chryseobacterium sp. JJR-5R]